MFSILLAEGYIYSSAVVSALSETSNNQWSYLCEYTMYCGFSAGIDFLITMLRDRGTLFW